MPVWWSCDWHAAMTTQHEGSPAHGDDDEDDDAAVGVRELWLRGRAMVALGHVSLRGAVSAAASVLFDPRGGPSTRPRDSPYRAGVYDVAISRFLDPPAPVEPTRAELRLFQSVLKRLARERVCTLPHVTYRLPAPLPTLTRASIDHGGASASPPSPPPAAGGVFLPQPLQSPPVFLAVPPWPAPSHLYGKHPTRAPMFRRSAAAAAAAAAGAADAGASGGGRQGYGGGYGGGSSSAAAAAAADDGLKRRRAIFSRGGGASTVDGGVPWLGEVPMPASVSNMLQSHGADGRRAQQRDGGGFTGTSVGPTSASASAQRIAPPPPTHGGVPLAARLHTPRPAVRPAIVVGQSPPSSLPSAAAAAAAYGFARPPPGAAAATATAAAGGGALVSPLRATTPTRSADGSLLQPSAAVSVLASVARAIAPLQQQSQSDAAASGGVPRPHTQPALRTLGSTVTSPTATAVLSSAVVSGDGAGGGAAAATSLATAGAASVAGGGSVSGVGVGGIALPPPVARTGSGISVSSSAVPGDGLPPPLFASRARVGATTVPLSSPSPTQSLSQPRSPPVVTPGMWTHAASSPPSHAPPSSSSGGHHQHPQHPHAKAPKRARDAGMSALHGSPTSSAVGIPALLAADALCSARHSRNSAGDRVSRPLSKAPVGNSIKERGFWASLRMAGMVLGDCVEALSNPWPRRLKRRRLDDVIAGGGGGGGGAAAAAGGGGGGGKGGGGGGGGGHRDGDMDGVSHCGMLVASELVKHSTEPKLVLRVLAGVLVPAGSERDQMCMALGITTAMNQWTKNDSVAVVKTYLQQVPLVDIPDMSQPSDPH